MKRGNRKGDGVKGWSIKRQKDRGNQMTNFLSPISSSPWNLLDKKTVKGSGLGLEVSTRDETNTRSRELLRKMRNATAFFLHKLLTKWLRFDNNPSRSRIKGPVGDINRASDVICSDPLRARRVEN